MLFFKGLCQSTSPGLFGQLYWPYQVVVVVGSGGCQPRRGVDDGLTGRALHLLVTDIGHVDLLDLNRRLLVMLAVTTTITTVG